ncbi:MAG: energy transducer TonB [Candidatus Latescibacteria bacterium]|nr:energy transducer TonB [Candidatus Latescibacterota bacterium]
MNLSWRAEALPLHNESELKQVYQSFFWKSFLCASAFVLFLAVDYYVVMAVRESRKVYSTRIVKYSDLGPPPPLTDAPPMPEVPVSAPARPVVGIPEPVPDTEVSAEQTIATQTEMSQGIAPIIRDTGAQNIIVEAPKEEKIVVEEEVLPAPDEFVAFEELPVPISQQQPKYPEMARRAGVEGMVILHVLIDKSGKVRDVRVIKGIGAGLDEAAVEAVRQWIYTPAIQNHKPVAVWVSQPMRFKLR